MMRPWLNDPSIAPSFFVFNAAAVTIAAAGANAASITGQGDTPFEITHLAAGVVSAGALVTAPLATATMNINGEDFSSNPTLLGNLFAIAGLAREPFALTAPIILKAKGTLIFNLSNFSAVSYTFYITALGRKLYKK